MHSRIGDETSRGISGGERKRVNIGIELVAAPVAIFLDEPTSGLDSAQAMAVCARLNEVAKATGITVAMVIHQPRVEIWQKLDRVLMLARGGRTVFEGLQDDAEKYFSSTIAVSFPRQLNPCDVIMDTIAHKPALCFSKWAEHIGEKVPGAAAPGTEPVQESSSVPASVSPRATLSPPTPTRWSMSSASSQVPMVKAPVAPAHAEPTSGRTPLAVASPSAESEREAWGTATVHLEPRGVSFLTQIWLCYCRSLAKQHHALPSVMLEMAVTSVGGLVAGVAGSYHYQGILAMPYLLIAAAPNEEVVPQIAMVMMMAIGLAASAAAVKTFSEERPV
eukprot:RCo000841